MAALPTIDPTTFWEQHANLHIRLLGRDALAGRVLAETARREEGFPFFRVDSAHSRTPPLDDYTQIDPTLPLDRDDGSAPDPLPHTSYAGMTPVQRRRFAHWLFSPELAAPEAFRHLYLAWLELALLTEEGRAAAIETIAARLDAPAWAGHRGLAQTAMLAGWLSQDGPLVARGLAHGGLSPEQLSLGCGWLASLQHPLEPDCALSLAKGWQIFRQDQTGRATDDDRGLLSLRITSLSNTLGADPLAWALEHRQQENETTNDASPAGDQERGASDTWRLWHPVHRQIRLLVPFVDLRAGLEPKLLELFAGLPQAQPRGPETSTPGQSPGIAQAQAGEWTLILEFGNSRSQHYDYVAHLARKQPGYQLLMDETRQLIHRIRFRKRNIRQFWRLWNYVENWSDVRVYVNGQEVQKWNVYPYSAEMR